MEVILDQKSGFCFGVKNAIELAEEALKTTDKLYCLGDIVHNEEEVARLSKLGLRVIDRQEYFGLRDCTVLIRAHGEPLETYEYAIKSNINLIEGTCPVVLKIQKKVRKANDNMEQKGQVVIFGKPNHAEVVGLAGQTGNNTIILSSESELDKIDFKRPISLFAQTTMDKQSYKRVSETIRNKLEISETNYHVSNSICGQVSNRSKWLVDFSHSVEAVIFVGGKKSSNSKVLFAQCLKANRNSFFINSPGDLTGINLSKFNRVGVCGATSTPQWLMDDVAKEIKASYN